MPDAEKEINIRDDIGQRQIKMKHQAQFLDGYRDEDMKFQSKISGVYEGMSF